MKPLPPIWLSAWTWLVLALLLTCGVYWPGLSGGWIFDDYSSIVLNPAVQPAHLGLSSLIDAALSSTAGPFKRPLASLSFALNFLAGGLDPYWMKLTNLLIHLLNGWLVFLLTRALLRSAGTSPIAEDRERRIGTTAVIVATAWMLLPINLTGVLYVVQRMESMANIFVLLGLLGYVEGRRRMLSTQLSTKAAASDTRNFALCAASLIIPTALGLLAKETAAMLPLYAALIEWTLFHGHRLGMTPAEPETGAGNGRADRRIWALFALVLALPMVIGLAWLAPGVLAPSTWATRDFTLRTRLLSEARIVLDYIRWTLLPTSRALSFYHDDFVVSSGWLTPWTTLASVLGLTAVAALTLWLRRRMPLVALGFLLFLGAQLLTGTILPLELIYEHRNYFASFGLLLALVPLLAAPEGQASQQRSSQGQGEPSRSSPTRLAAWQGALPHARLRHGLLAALMLAWTMQTALGAYIWGSPSRLALTLAERAPQSPRAQYALGLSYSIYSQYNPTSPFVPLAYDALEKAARLPKSSILPEQALIFLNARMHMPAKSAWWDSLLAKLRMRVPTPEDQNALRTLSICAIDHRCDLPTDRMNAAFRMILSHPNPGAQMYARYGDYAWNVLKDRALGERMMAKAVQVNPREPDYRVALIRMLVALGQKEEARRTLQALESLNTGGYLDKTLRELQALTGLSGSTDLSNLDDSHRT